MKKTLSVFVALVMCLALCACGSETVSKNGKNITNKETAANDGNTIATIQETSTPETTGKLQTDSNAIATIQETSIPETTDKLQTDLLSIEEVEVSPKKYKDEYQISWKIKVRNISGADLPMKESSMKIFFKYLDANNDILWSSYAPGGYTSTVEDGQAEMISYSSHPSDWGAKEMNQIAYIEFYAYTTSTGGSPDHEFIKPITVKVSDYFEWADYNPQ